MSLTIRYPFENDFSEAERILFWPISLALSHKNPLEHQEIEKQQCKLPFEKRERFAAFNLCAQKKIKYHLNEVRYICAEINAIEQDPLLFKQDDLNQDNCALTFYFENTKNRMTANLNALIIPTSKSKCTIL